MNGKLHEQPLEVPWAENRSGCLISKKDWELLQQASEAERERSYRNLFAGIAGSGAVGTLGIGVSHFGHLFSSPMTPTESACLVLMTSATLAASALAIFFHQRVKKTGPGQALRKLTENIRLAFEYPQTAGDPRRWP